MSEWLAGCTRQDFGTSGGSWTRQPAIIVVHSTEGTSFPGYDGGSSAPHFTINVATGERRQHISMGEAARALMNASGGVETNRGGAIQIETIGTCDPSHDGDAGWLYLPKMSAAQAANLGRLNPGPEGLGPTVAGAVWDYGTTSAVDGTPQDTVTLLRWAQGDAHNAADYDTGGGVKGRQHSRSDPVTWAAVAALVRALVCFVMSVT